VSISDNCAHPPQNGLAFSAAAAVVLAVDTALSIVVLGAFALVLGAIALWRRGVRRQALLMLLLAAIAAVNVAIWVVPNEDGKALVNAKPG
jgi:hypothetical protein